MTWPAQVRHVFFKDCRQFWLVPAVLLVATGLRAARAVGAIASFGTLELPVDMLSALAIAFAMGVVVLADPPARTTAFWATQPLQPSAVAAAKLVFLFAILAMLVTVAIVVASAWHLRTAQLLITLGRLGAVVATIGGVGAAIGALGGDRKGASGAQSTIMAFIMAAYVLLMITKGPSAQLHRAIDVMPELLWPLLLAISIALLLQLYRQREHTRPLRVAAYGATMLPVVMLFREAPQPAPLSHLASDSAAVSMRALWNNETADRLELALTSPGDDAAMLRVLNDATVTAVMHDGTRIPFAVSHQRLVRADGRLPAVKAATQTPVVIGANSAPRTNTPYESFWVATYMEQSRLLQGVERWELEGTLDDYRVEEADRFPVRSNLTSAKDGRLVGASLRYRRASPLVRLEMRWLVTPDRTTMWPLPAPLREYHTLYQTFSALSAAGDSLLPLRWIDCSGADQFVNLNMSLPGFRTGGFVCTLQPAVWSVARPPVSEHWLGTAQILSGTPVLLRSARVRATAPVATIR